MNYLNRLKYKIENFNRPITSKEIELVIRNLTMKSLGPDGFTGELSKTFKEGLTPVPLQPFQRIEE